MVHSAYSFKDTYWNKVRVEANIKISDIAKLLGAKYSTTGAYFSGMLMPPDEVIKTLCEFFDIDIAFGTNEFDKAHKAYDAIHKRELKYTARKKKVKATPINQPDIFEKCEEIPEPDSNETDILTEETEVVKSSNEMVGYKTYSDVMRILYGVVSYDEFNRFSSKLILEDSESALKYAYALVDFDTFKRLAKAIDEAGC